MRQLYKTRVLSDVYGSVEVASPVTELKDANLIGSTVLSSRGKLHMPTLDIDFPTSLVPSRTEGHFHLFIDYPMTWRKYKRLLRALKRAGLIQTGWYKGSRARRFSSVRAHTTD